MTVNSNANAIVAKMFDNDPMSQWCGMERISVEPGRVVLQMVVRPEMLNGFAIAHGGIAYLLADSALAFAANGHGIQAVSIETSISHVAPVKEGDVLVAETEEINLTKSTGLYYVNVFVKGGKKVAFFKGTVFRTGKQWEV